MNFISNDNVIRGLIIGIVINLHRYVNKRIHINKINKVTKNL